MSPFWSAGCRSEYSLDHKNLFSGFWSISACFAWSSWSELRLSIFGKPSLSAAISKFVVLPFHIEIRPLYFGFQNSSQPVAWAGSTLSVR